MATTALPADAGLTFTTETLTHRRAVIGKADKYRRAKDTRSFRSLTSVRFIYGRRFQEPWESAVELFGMPTDSRSSGTVFYSLHRESLPARRSNAVCFDTLAKFALAGAELASLSSCELCWSRLFSTGMNNLSRTGISSRAGRTWSTLNAVIYFVERTVKRKKNLQDPEEQCVHTPEPCASL